MARLLEGVGRTVGVTGRPGDGNGVGAMYNTSKPFRSSACRLSVAVGAAVMMIAAASSPASAKPVADNLDVGKTLNVTVTGQITARCEIQGGGDIDLGELRGGERVTGTFGLDCNVPFNLQMTSANGGLAHVSQPQGEGPFAGVLPYDVRLTVPTLRPTPAVVQGGFYSLQRTGTLSSGDGISAGSSKIEIETRRPTGAGLLAGKYSETLRLTVTPS